MTFVYYRNTKDRVDDEHEAEAMAAADDARVDIDYEQFLQDVPAFNEIAALMGYGEDLAVAEDWHVSFCESVYDGVPCRIFCHSECDFLFLPKREAQRRAERFALGTNALDWERKTSFGKGGIDPTASDFARSKTEVADE